MTAYTNGYNNHTNGCTNALTSRQDQANNIDYASSPLSALKAQPMTTTITKTGRTYLFGHPISHSLSPVVHNTVFSALPSPISSWTYTLHESLSIPSFLSLLHQPECKGSAVTMPHKVAIIEYLDELTEEARLVGAVNTVVVKESVDGEEVDSENNSLEGTGQKTRRRYVGTNTDVVGIREAYWRNVRNAKKTLTERPSLIIGGGGAARSALYVLHTHFHSPVIYIINRDAAEVASITSSCPQPHLGYTPNIVHIRSVADAEAAEAVSAVVGCVPDFPPRTEAEREARRCVEVMLVKRVSREGEDYGDGDDGGIKGALLEMAYHPRLHTELGALAERAGWQVILGTEAMLYQGLEQDRLWTGVEVEKMPLQMVRKRLEEAVLDAEH